MLDRRLIRSVQGIGVALLVAGCDAKILAFDVQPRRVCGGDSVHISWRVRGTPHVEAVRRTQDSVDVIRYTLVAESRGKRVSKELDVTTYSQGAPVILGFDAAMLGTDSLVARSTLRAPKQHDFRRVGEVSSDTDRRLLVRHGGIDGDVQPGPSGNSAWRGKLVSGAWELRSALKPGEVPGHPRKHPPMHYDLKVSLVCDARGAVASGR